MIMMNIDDNIFIRIKHLHPNNSSRRERKGAKYRTIAWALEKGTSNAVAWADAVCSKHDVPSRKRGRKIAVGRLIKKLETVTE